jgi:hypothetical protein
MSLYRVTLTVLYPNKSISERDVRHVEADNSTRAKNDARLCYVGKVDDIYRDVGIISCVEVQK